MSPSQEQSYTNPLEQNSYSNSLDEKFPIILENSDGKLNKAPMPKKHIPVIEIPVIRPSFPPPITAIELFEKLKLKELNKQNALYDVKTNTGKKAPNKFLIYRAVFVETLRQLNCHYSMTHISGIIAQRWKEEPKDVKDAYTRIAEEVCSLTKQHYGEFSKKKGKRGQTRVMRPVNHHHHQITNEMYNVESLDPSNTHCINYPIYSQYGSYGIPSSNHLNPIYPNLPPATYLPPPQQIYQDNNDFQFKQEPYVLPENYIYNELKV